MAFERGPSMSAEWKAELDAIIGEIEAEIVELRRHLHSHPEPSGEELRTSLHLYQLLGRLELDVRMGPDGCGVVAENELEGEAETRQPPVHRVALRGDIDALRIQDEKTVAYRSTNAGVMHACGHDAHTAIVYGAARALVTLDERCQSPWPVAWRAIFQPAEESAVGAARMIETGALEDVSQIFALHIDPSRRTGEIGVRSGAMTAHCDSLQLTVRGQGGHAARPHESRDPIAASAQLINALYQYVPRTTETHEAVVLTIGRLRGGENPNVIPSTVELWGTLRTLDSTVRARIIEKIRQVARGVGEVTSTEIDLELQVSIPSVHNDAALTRLVWREAEEVVGADHVQLIARPSMGSEDFACFLQRVPGVMFRLGCSDDLASSKGLHTPMFDIDEKSLGIGVRIMARAAIMACQPGAASSG
jgi:amidohydrolase